MEKGDIYTQVEKYVRRFSRSSSQPIGPDTPLSKLGLDSLDKVEMIFEIEKHFDVEISDDVVRHLHTVEDLVAFLRANARLSM